MGKEDSYSISGFKDRRINYHKTGHYANRFMRSLDGKSLDKLSISCSITNKKEMAVFIKYLQRAKECLK